MRKQTATLPVKVIIDTTAPLHHFSVMRLTINLDDDLYAMARSHAVIKKTSISKAVGDLMRQRSRFDSSDFANQPNFSIDPETLLPVVKGHGKMITEEEIQRSLDDEDLRHLEIADWAIPAEPKEL